MAYVNVGMASGQGDTGNISGSGVSKFVACTTARDSSASDRILNDLTFNGVSFTRVVAHDDGFLCSSEIWYLDDPPEGNYPVVPDFNGGVGFKGVGVMSFTGLAPGPPTVTDFADNSTDPGADTELDLAGSKSGSLIISAYVSNTSTLTSVSGAGVLFDFASTRRRIAVHKTGSGNDLVNWVGGGTTGKSVVAASFPLASAPVFEGSYWNVGGSRYKLYMGDGSRASLYMGSGTRFG